MTLRGCRIVKTRHAATAFSGDGARKYGARWNSPGIPIVYVSGSIALAMLEILVHVDADELLSRYSLFEVAFPDSLVSILDPATLPRNWKSSPAPAALQRIGDTWFQRASSPILRVPSVIAPGEWNYLLNPTHPQFSKITIGPRHPIHFDRRLLKRP